MIVGYKHVSAAVVLAAASASLVMAVAAAAQTASPQQPAKPSPLVVTIPGDTPSPGVTTVDPAPVINMRETPTYQATMGVSAQAGPQSILQVRPKIGKSVTFDLYSGVVTIPEKTPPYAAGGVSVYTGIIDNFASGVAGIGGSMLSICEVSNCSVWGDNLVVLDSPDNKATGATGQALNGEEIDIRAFNAHHRAIHGIDIQAHFFQKPDGVATAFSCLAAQYSWDNCTLSPDNSAITALYVGAMARNGPEASEAKGPLPSDDPSQFIKFGFTYGEEDRATGRARLGAGMLQAIPSARPGEGSTLEYKTLGGGPADIRADGFSVRGARGVSCKGPPTADFTVENGIVTHC